MVTIVMPVAAGFALSMPTSAPAMAMVYGTGYLKIRHVLVTGVPLSILGAAVLTAFALLLAACAHWWPLVLLRE